MSVLMYVTQSGCKLPTLVGISFITEYEKDTACMHARYFLMLFLFLFLCSSRGWPAGIWQYSTALCARTTAAACSFSRDEESKQSNQILGLGSARNSSSALLIGFCSFCWVAGEVSKILLLTQLVTHALHNPCRYLCFGFWGPSDLGDWTVSSSSHVPLLPRPALRCPPRAWLAVSVSLCVV